MYYEEEESVEADPDAEGHIEPCQECEDLAEAVAEAVTGIRAAEEQGLQALHAAKLRLTGITEAQLRHCRSHSETRADEHTNM